MNCWNPRSSSLRFRTYRDSKDTANKLVNQNKNSLVTLRCEFFMYSPLSGQSDIIGFSGYKQ